MLQIANIIIYASILSVLVPIICFLLKRKRNFTNAPIRILSILLFVSAFSDFGSYALFKAGKSSIPLNNIYIIVQFFLLSYIYYLLLEKKKIIYIASFIFIGFCIINTFFIQSFNEFQSWTDFVEGIFIIIYSIKYYRQILKTRIDLLRFSPFWINTAVYFYFAFNLFLFSITNYIIKNIPPDIGLISWGFHNLNNIAKNILFAVAIYYVGVKQEEYREAKF